MTNCLEKPRPQRTNTCVRALTSFSIYILTICVSLYTLKQLFQRWSVQPPYIEISTINHNRLIPAVYKNCLHFGAAGSSCLFCCHGYTGTLKKDLLILVLEEVIVMEHLALLDVYTDLWISVLSGQGRYYRIATLGWFQLCVYGVYGLSYGSEMMKEPESIRQSQSWWSGHKISEVHWKRVGISMTVTR